MKNKIGKILFRKIILWYLAVAVVVTILQIYNEYTTEKKRLISSVHSIEKTFYKPLVSAVWNLDGSQIKNNSESIVSLDDIVGVSIVDEDNKVLFEYSLIDLQEVSDVEEVLNQKKLLQHSFELIHEEHLSEVLAVVTLFSTTDIIFQNMREHVLVIIASAMVKSLVLLFLFLFFSNKMITRPLKRLIDRIKTMEFGKYQDQDACLIDPKQASEITVLFDSYNDMQIRIHEEIKKNKAFEKLFEHSSDGLLVIEDGKFTQCNQSAIDMLGFESKSELFGLTPADISPAIQPDGKSSKTKADELLALVLEKGKHNFEWVHKTNNGQEFWIDVTLTTMTMHDKDIVYVTWRDISRRKFEEERSLRQQETLYHQANHDSLTQLPNRMFFNEKLEQSIARAKRHKMELAVFFIDLDEFKPINDTLGHEVGDRVLQKIAWRLKGLIRIEDTLSRLGGDEFTILVEDLKQGTDVSRLAQDILDSVTKPLNIDEHILHVSCSIGISLYPQDDGGTCSLLKYADAAMYKAKAKGRNNYQYYVSDKK